MNPRQVNRQGSRPTFDRPQRRASRSAGGKGSRWRPSLPSWRPRLSSWRQLALIVLILASIVGFFYLTQLNTIKVTGNKALSVAKITEYTKAGLSRQIFGGSLPLINTGALEKYLEETDPAIKSAQVSRAWPSTLLVVITERQPSLNWKSGGESYVLDIDGTVIGPTPAAYASLPTVIDNTNLPVKEGSRVAGDQFISFTGAILGKLKAAGITATSLSVPETTTELYVRTSQGYTIKFDTTRTADSQFTDLQLVQKQLQALKKTPAEYIDLRIEHKAYYR